jgi:pimeloyl-ACP methyl ester carboxylesterase
VLVLHGDRTALPSMAQEVDYVARHVPQVEVRQIAGAGHLAHVTHPETMATELDRFFGSD